MINFYDSFYSQNILRRLINDYTVNSDTENPCIDCLLCCYDTLRFIYLFRLCIYENIRCGRIWENNYKWQFVKYIAVATMINFLYDTLKFFSVVTIRARLFRRRIHYDTEALDTILEFISTSRGRTLVPLDH